MFINLAVPNSNGLRSESLVSCSFRHTCFTRAILEDCACFGERLVGCCLVGTITRLRLRCAFCSVLLRCLYTAFADKFTTYHSRLKRSTRTPHAAILIPSASLLPASTILEVNSDFVNSLPIKRAWWSYMDCGLNQSSNCLA